MATTATVCRSHGHGWRPVSPGRVDEYTDTDMPDARVHAHTHAYAQIHACAGASAPQHKAAAVGVAAAATATPHASAPVFTAHTFLSDATMAALQAFLDANARKLALAPRDERGKRVSYFGVGRVGERRVGERRVGEPGAFTLTTLEQYTSIVFSMAPDVRQAGQFHARALSAGAAKSCCVMSVTVVAGPASCQLRAAQWGGGVHAFREYTASGGPPGVRRWHEVVSPPPAPALWELDDDRAPVFARDGFLSDATMAALQAFVDGNARRLALVPLDERSVRVSHFGVGRAGEGADEGAHTHTHTLNTLEHYTSTVFTLAASVKQRVRFEQPAALPAPRPVDRPMSVTIVAWPNGNLLLRAKQWAAGAYVSRTYTTSAIQPWHEVGPPPPPALPLDA